MIATDLGGHKETIQNGKTGWLVPPNIPQSLADAIIKAMCETPEQRLTMIHAGMQQVHAQYDKRKMVADTIKVYEEVLRARSA